MRIPFAPAWARRSLAAAVAVLALAACDKTLTVEPVNEVEEKEAIIDAGSARAALAGLYDALQSGSYYGGDFNFFLELPTDNADHVGTFTTYADVDKHVTTADNSTIEGMWDAVYQAVGRANTIIAMVPGVSALDEAEKNDILGQAYAIRALAYHDLVKVWGPVPIRTAPAASLAELADTQRAPVDQVYTQILADLTKASTLMDDEARTRKASKGFVNALRSRVQLYRANWAAAEAAAEAVVDEGYELAEHFEDLFDPEGNDTNEDILRASFTATEYNLLGFYYQSKSYGGRWELAPTTNMMQQYEAGDERGAWTLALDGRRRRYVAKYPTTVGAEDLHVIRFGEVLLSLAEAQARQGKLSQAVDTYNQLRERAGVAPHQLGVDVTSQAEVIAAILQERRRELAFEGDRWPDLVRTGRAITLLNIPSFRTLFPVPTNEIDVAPRMTQNPGY
ncbi:MAG: RagB/SusD family nutrient uptake outer membrane protein [Gemmatimonadaceae bacterium]|nr:RagB/SusD family nutrient uptake outer membrane protein [Gemmatimonadaceae bacterium]